MTGAEKALLEKYETALRSIAGSTCCSECWKAAETAKSVLPSKTVWRVEHDNGSTLQGVSEFDQRGYAETEVIRLLDGGYSVHIWRKEALA